MIDSVPLHIFDGSEITAVITNSSCIIRTSGSKNTVCWYAAVPDAVVTRPCTSRRCRSPTSTASPTPSSSWASASAPSTCPSRRRCSRRSTRSSRLRLGKRTTCRRFSKTLHTAQAMSTRSTSGCGSVDVLARFLATPPGRSPGACRG